VIAWVAKDKKLIALNASGRAPSGATPQHIGGARLQRQHAAARNRIGNGSGRGRRLDVLLKRAGTMTFKETLEPAATLAEQGFGITDASIMIGSTARRFWPRTPTR